MISLGDVRVVWAGLYLCLFVQDVCYGLLECWIGRGGEGKRGERVYKGIPGGGNCKVSAECHARKDDHGR